MKHLFILIAFALCWPLYSQPATLTFTEDGFAREVLKYEPLQRASVSDKAYAYGKMILAEVVSATEGKAANFCVADYMNVLSAFLTLDESPEATWRAFAKLATAEGSCEYFLKLRRDVADNEKYLPVWEEWNTHARDCAAREAAPSATDPEAYAALHQLDPSLVRTIAAVHERDQRFRLGGYRPWQQRPLDWENERIVDSLFAIHDEYVGKSLVGPKYAATMWLVIQHSRLPTMEKYLPVIRKAVREQELAPATLKMLIDRIYATKHGHQIFGSQFGVDLAEEPVRIRVRSEYGLR